MTIIKTKHLKNESTTLHCRSFKCKHVASLIKRKSKQSLQTGFANTEVEKNTDILIAS